MIEMIISGGQTGADQAGWRAAKAFGIPTSGWMPKGFLTEAGPCPKFENLYGAMEHSSNTYSPRTRANMKWSDATIVFDCSGAKNLIGMSHGTQLAINTAMKYERPSLVVHVNPKDFAQPVSSSRPQAMASRIAEQDHRILNIAGNRESSYPGIGAWVEEYLCAVFAFSGFCRTFTPVRGDLPS